MTERKIEFTTNKIVFHVLFTLKQGLTGFIDELIVEMKAENKLIKSGGYYSNSIKIFSDPDGIKSIGSIISIEPIETNYKIKFTLGTIIKEIILIEGNTLSNKTKATLIEEYNKKLENVMNQICDLRQMILKLNEKKLPQNEIKKIENEDLIINDLISRIIQCEEKIKANEQTNSFIKEKFIVIEKRINEIENKIHVIHNVTNNSNENEKNLNDIFKKRLTECILKTNTCANELIDVKKKVSMSIMDNDEKYTKILEDISILKNKSTQTEISLLDINKKLNSLLSPKTQITKSKTEPTVINYKDCILSSQVEKSDTQIPKLDTHLSNNNYFQSQQKTPRLESESKKKKGEHKTEPLLFVLSSPKDQQHKTKSKSSLSSKPTIPVVVTPPLEEKEKLSKGKKSLETHSEPSLNSSKEPEPKRKQLHKIKKSNSKTMKTSIQNTGNDDIKKTIEINPGVLNKITSVYKETSKSKTKGSGTLKTRPKASVIDPDNLKENFERKQAIKEKEIIQNKSQNDLIFKELKEGEVMHIICNENNPEQQQIIKWLINTVKTNDFWEVFDEQEPKGIIIVCTNKEEGLEMKMRVRKLFGDIPIQLIGLEGETASVEGFIKIHFHNGEVTDENGHILQEFKKWN
ncbi:early endsome antigen 1, putative [Entamoeba histolytica HM-1:IMSS-B]|uniref:Early endsome antigen 1, putative n=4 Tax=Entamoeba histolytica TaxID=5759 RepID=C4M9D8_ENTH1|nr:early endsome antigen 1, putative [Entamoeba histolytica HM-1:IMSS]EAL45008.1 early endsome antigen 1, putative [Entamoeba histolytica HM-1:IMSS]EMH77225.1 early endsome antigen 1, putative [Entamoeba histolytica HM-1:IMSS-B]ENY64981.1 early endsome antigen 1, putative [Entamoeba histolytica HM-1:IMSS-A]GAT98276.1 early endsome antigen 1 putative [Entamoeba histolytica]|eukprot:XP_650394.1 early endsome antigen 1, putative [Entamoeba histolytica HM-1:IMSS]